MNKKNSRSEECVLAWHNTGNDTDIQGSYTGTFKASDEVKPEFNRPYIYMEAKAADELRPIQDADDL